MCTCMPMGGGRAGGRLLAWLYMQVYYISIHRSLNISLLCVYMYVFVCLCIRVGGWMDGWMDADAWMCRFVCYIYI